MEPKERVKLLDELMTVVQVMDEMYQYHPQNPNQVDIFIIINNELLRIKKWSKEPS